MNQNLFTNCEITADDINRGKLIYGSLELHIEGHAIRHKPPLHPKTNKVNFLTAQCCASRSLRTIMTVLEKVVSKHTCRSFNLCDFYGDDEFDKEALRHFLNPALLRIYGREEHVGSIERSVRTVKERFKSTCSNVPYRNFAILMVMSLVEGIIEVLNALPSKNSVLFTISPPTNNYSSLTMLSSSTTITPSLLS